MHTFLKYFRDREILAIVVISMIFLLISIYLGAISEGDIIAGEESFNHFLISKYSLSHPELFVDLYGKPVFTLLLSLPAQFGILGVKVMNILVVIGYSLVSYKLAKKNHLKFPVIALLTSFLIPYSFISGLTSLTEPLTALLTILVFYLAIENKYLAGSLIASFLPYLRYETSLLLCLWIVYLISQKDYINALYCLFGTLLFQVIGFLYYKDLFWLINNNLNLSHTSVYIEKASPLFYLSNFQVYANPIITLLVLSGIVTFFMRKRDSTRKSNLFFLFLFIWPTVDIFLLSISQWLGIFGAYGSLRYLIPLTPFFALFSAKGFEILMSIKTLNYNTLKILGIVFGLLSFWYIFPPGNADVYYHSHWVDIKLMLLLIAVIGSFILVIPIYKLDRYKSILLALLIFLPSIGFLLYTFHLPLPLNDEQQIMKQVALWLNKEDLTHSRLYYFYPYLSYILDKDPYNPFYSEKLWKIHRNFVPDGSIIIWDGHFGPNEMFTPLNSLKNNPNYRLLKAFIPNKSFTTENNSLFQVFIFQKK